MHRAASHRAASPRGPSTAGRIGDGFGRIAIDQSKGAFS
ncbi:hypothetical protein GBP346_B2848 [Burkholderia pseudomallei MSHR346]|nr:hypothetical protein GBP346_B2848 [Burkholderia pseudomallei MSHR346]